MTAKYVHELEPGVRGVVIDTFIKYNLMGTLREQVRVAKLSNTKFFDMSGYRWDTRFTEMLLNELEKEKLDVPSNGYPIG